MANPGFKLVADCDTFFSSYCFFLRYAVNHPDLGGTLYDSIEFYTYNYTGFRQVIVTYLFLQTKNNTPDLALPRVEFMRMYWFFNIVCTIVNVIILKSLVLALISGGYRKTLSGEVDTWNISPHVMTTLHRATHMGKGTDIRAIERAAFDS